ncbi:SRPBCC family protein [Sphingobacterium sp. HJSM2_6]|uniref:SRPBCC family protein n=1 Tax=Sphingobacterium sp. HJSM2_6 TaxID=3366264 RepID=UPI003BC229EE
MDSFTIKFEFNAHISQVFNAWLDPAKFSIWLGPSGSQMTFLQADVREGGQSFWEMIMLDGSKKYGVIHFMNIVRDERLIYKQHFCDATGGFIQAPFSDSYPAYLMTIVHFTRMEDFSTQIQLTWEVLPDATAMELDTFQEMKPLMRTGWTESFFKLKGLLES